MMSIQIPTPNITATSDRECLLQIQSYLFKMAKQLQYAFDTLETGKGGSSQIKSGRTASGNGEDTAKTAFSGIKELIIKSADIVNAYYAVISKRLEGMYVAQSDFGKYAESTEAEIQANSLGVNQLFTNIRQISETVDGLYDGIVETNAYLKTGLLGESSNGVPVYGLEIGQTVIGDTQNSFEKFARFTTDRLSFYDRNDVEIAYISDYRLYITNAEIGGSVVIGGRFKIFSNSGLIFKWLGGSK